MWGLRRWRRLGRVALVLMPAIGVGLVGGTGLMAYVVLHPPTLSSGETPAEVPGLVYHEVSFETADGLTLRGWYLPSRNGATVILIHGFARDRSELLPEGLWLVERGFGALLYDSRAQGASDGAYISLGYREGSDVRAAVDFVRGQAPEERIGAMGYSMGAVAAVEAAAVDERIRAVLAVSPFATLRETVEYNLRRARPLIPLVVWWGERMTGLRLEELRPVDHVAALAPRPVLIMEAGEDGVLAPGSGRRLYEVAGEPKELWAVEGLEHVDFRQALPEAYRQRVIEFFERALVPDSGHDLRD
jgi:dipeptidyl aminopeptidase/acylaminoacyl peptidase